jgi:GLEYA domain
MGNYGFNQVFSWSTQGFGSAFSYSGQLPRGYKPGIKRDTYTTGYFADDLSWFNGRIPTSTDYPLSLIQDPSSDDGSDYSRRWTGYFRAPTSETYTFYLSSDDSSWMWLGPQAARGWSNVNALVNNSGLHGVVEKSGSVSLAKGTLYPILVFFGERGGGDVLDFSYSTPTIPKTTDLTGLIFYNSLSTDGRGF